MGERVTEREYVCMREKEEKRGTDRERESVYVCMCVCERVIEKERDRQTDRQTARQRQTEGMKERERE